MGRDARIYGTQISARTRTGQYIEWILSSISSSLFKAHGKKIWTNAVKTSAEVADDVLEGKTVKSLQNDEFQLV